ncbi:hypothetical protein SKAU_G00239980 [Synaphobranchus kaupii]|uniref:Uncharacterized protein n=1 Tax=Synaphobranchus kaupii TaxID=118154 RepID=A0A9Q1F799_SYNKA|nr:hypothetical protein SKAU_G00239980 [Synaphobranchus kaupii]
MRGPRDKGGAPASVSLGGRRTLFLIPIRRSLGEGFPVHLRVTAPPLISQNEHFAYRHLSHSLYHRVCSGTGTRTPNEAHLSARVTAAGEEAAGLGQWDGILPHSLIAGEGGLLGGAGLPWLRVATCGQHEERSEETSCAQPCDPAAWSWEM